MARTPVTDDDLISRYGPHLNEAPPGGWDAGLTIDKVVNTHCCFCGCLLYTSPSPRDRTRSRMPSSA